MNLVTSDTCRILLSCCCRCYSVSPVSSSLEGWCHQIMGNVSLTNQLGTHAEMSVLVLLLVVEFWLPFLFLSFREWKDRVIHGIELFDFLRVTLVTVLSLIAFTWLTHLPKRYLTLIWWLRRQENPSHLSLKVQQSSSVLWTTQSHTRMGVQQSWVGVHWGLEAHLHEELHPSQEVHGLFRAVTLSRVLFGRWLLFYFFLQLLVRYHAVLYISSGGCSLWLQTRRIIN